MTKTLKNTTNYLLVLDIIGPKLSVLKSSSVASSPSYWVVVVVVDSLVSIIVFFVFLVFVVVVDLVGFEVLQIFAGCEDFANSLVDSKSK